MKRFLALLFILAFPAAAQHVGGIHGDTANACARFDANKKLVAASGDCTSGASAPSNSFATIDLVAGTDPVAESPTDTLFISCAAPLTCTGNSGTDTWTTSFADQTTNFVFAAQAAGPPTAPAFRALVDNDIPNTITVNLAAVASEALLLDCTGCISSTNIGPNALIPADFNPSGSGAAGAVPVVNVFGTGFTWVQEADLFPTLAAAAQDLSCTNCIGGAEIDESILATVPTATLAGTAGALTCTNCIGGTEILESALGIVPTATTANAGDSASGFFSSGTIEAARLPATWTLFAFGAVTTNTTTTPTAITGFTIPVTTGNNIRARCAVVSGGAATTTGVQVTFAGPTASQIAVNRSSCAGVAVAPIRYSAAGFAADNSLNSSGTGVYCIETWDFIVVNATNGTDITAQVDTEVGASSVSVYAGSYCEWMAY